MAFVKTSLEGFEPLRRLLQEAPEAVALLSAQAVSASTFAVLQGAIALAPRRTGALRGALTWKATSVYGRVGLATGRGRGKVGPETYWRFVEFGTRHVPARPFLRPAAERERDVFVKRLRDIGPKLQRDLSAGRFA